jgi:KaiC/GvpD/RAD55 family RecA-like ATPase
MRVRLVSLCRPRMLSRLATSALLLAVIVSTLTTWSGVPQQVVTYTNTVNFTTAITRTGYTLSIISTSYVTTVQPETLYSGPFSVPHTGGTYSCNSNNLPLTASKGNEIVGKFSADTLVSFYIVTAAYFNQWQGRGSGWPCEPNGDPSEVLFSADGVNQRSFDVIIPKDGTYEIVFVNYSTQNANVSLNVAEPGISVTSTGYVYSTREYAETITTSGSSLVFQTGLAGVLSAFPFGLLGVVGLTATIGIISFLLVSMRRRKAATSTILQPAAASQASKAKGRSLPNPSSAPSIPTGYGELDRMLAGGLPEGYAVVLVSPSYDERDLLIRKIVESSLGSGRPAFYLSDDIARTRDLTTRFSQNFYALSPVADKIASDRANLFKVPSVGDLSNLNISSNQIIEGKSKNSKSNMIVIDILSDSLLRNKALTTRRWLSDFVAKRKAGGFTIVATLDPSIAPKEDVQTIAGVFDGVIEVFERSLQERTRRFLVIKKMYGREYSDDELMLDRQQLL